MALAKICSIALAVLPSVAPALAAAADGSQPPTPAPSEPTSNSTANLPTAAAPAPAATGAASATNEDTLAQGKASQAGNAVTPAATPDRFQHTFFGFIRLASTVVQNDPNVHFVGRADGFELQNARAGVRSTYQNRVFAELSIDGALDERIAPNQINGRIRPTLVDAFVDVAVGGNLQGLTFRAGRFAIVMDPDFDVVTPPNYRVFVDRSLLSRGVRPTEGYEVHGMSPGRSMGASLRYDSGQITHGVRPGFELAVQNGADEFSSANDNDAFALSAAGFLRMPNAGIVLATVRYNPRTVGDLPFQQDQNDFEGEAAARVPAGPVSLMVAGAVRYTTFPTTGGPAQTAWGGQAQASYALPLELPLSVAYRFSILDPSNLVLTDRVMEHTGGGVLSLPSLRARVQLNFTHVAEQSQRKLANDRVEAVLEVSL